MLKAGERSAFSFITIKNSAERPFTVLASTQGLIFEAIPADAIQATSTNRAIAIEMVLLVMSPSRVNILSLENQYQDSLFFKGFMEFNWLSFACFYIEHFHEY